MSTVFGESGPKNVEVLSHPARRQSKVSGPPTAATARVGEEQQRGSLDSVMDAEAGDHFEMLPAPPPSQQQQQQPQNRTWAGARPAVVPQFSSFSSNASSSTDRGIERWSSRSNMGSSRISTSQRFAQPLVSEGKGSVFPVGLALSKRRELEVDIIKRFDRLDVNTHVGEFWMIIDAAWMSSWVDFVMGNAPPPGPISNRNLFVHFANNRRESMLVNQAASTRGGVLASRPDLRLKDGLKKVRDYRAVHGMVWYLFREIYTADDSPEICRWHADIYQAEVQATRKFKFCQDMHTRAVYELRRFCGKIKEEMYTS